MMVFWLVRWSLIARITRLMAIGLVYLQGLVQPKFTLILRCVIRGDERAFIEFARNDRRRFKTWVFP